MNRKKAGLLLILLGVAMWPIGLFALQLKPVPNVLALHLLFIFSGVYMRGNELTNGLRNRWGKF